MIQSIRGFKDILPDEMKLWQHITQISVSLLQDFNYREISTPIVEKTDLFARTVGENTDIVDKEMYTFKDVKGESLTLRPEATASIVRAYIQHKLYAVNSTNRLYCFGPMFRRERPQKGRYRQFYQLSVETFGIESSHIDAELIFMLHTLFFRLSISNIVVRLNSLGCPVCRPFFKKYLLKKIVGIKAGLCPNCIKRKDTNPLRLFDCKVLTCREIMKDIKGIAAFLCDECNDHFDKVIKLLRSFGIVFKLDASLVRGLDYYTRTVFEIHHGSLGAQSAIAGGGRYDGLVKSLGGPDISAIGFALGINRLVKIINPEIKSVVYHIDLFIAVLGSNAMRLAFDWQMKLNSNGIRVSIGKFDQSLKAQMKQANRFCALYVLIVGDQEIKNGKIVFRCMRNGEQSYILVDDVFAKMIDIFAKEKL